MLVRQGDVLLKKVDALPDGAKPVQAQDGRYILAYGEQTGHSHSIAAIPGVVEMLESEGVSYIRVIEPTPVVHQEHSAAPLDAGIYKVVIQREYTPAEIRRVID